MDFQSVYGNEYGRDELETEGLYLLDKPIFNYDQKKAAELARHKKISRDLILQDQMRYGYPTPYKPHMATMERFTQPAATPAPVAAPPQEDRIDDRTLLFIIIIMLVIIVVQQNQISRMVCAPGGGVSAGLTPLLRAPLVGQ